MRNAVHGGRATYDLLVRRLSSFYKSLLITTTVQFGHSAGDLTCVTNPRDAVRRRIVDDMTSALASAWILMPASSKRSTAYWRSYVARVAPCICGCFGALVAILFVSLIFCSDC